MSIVFIAFAFVIIFSYSSLSDFFAYITQLAFWPCSYALELLRFREAGVEVVLKVVINTFYCA